MSMTSLDKWGTSVVTFLQLYVICNETCHVVTTLPTSKSSASIPGGTGSDILWLVANSNRFLIPCVRWERLVWRLCSSQLAARRSDCSIARHSVPRGWPSWQNPVAAAWTFHPPLYSWSLGNFTFTSSSLPQVHELQTSSNNLCELEPGGPNVLFYTRVYVLDVWLAYTWRAVLAGRRFR